LDWALTSASHFLLSAIAALYIFLVERKKRKAAEKIAAQAQASR
jgi:hypothetical protein